MVRFQVNLLIFIDFKLVFFIELYKHSVFHENKQKKNSFLIGQNEKSRFFKKRENLQNFFLDNIKTARAEKFERIHRNKNEEIFKKRRSFGILPLKYFSDNIKSSKKFY